MDVVLLSRLQFAVSTHFHFLFVPLTLGLSVLIAIMETLAIRRQDEEYRRMARFWGRIFLINFAVGIVTGITLEFQFGTNWSGYSEYMGDIFGSLLAIEATAAFFVESTFIGVWAFGWRRLSAKAHAVVAWIIAGAAGFSAIWILIANAWMQHPVGYVINEELGRAELSDFFAVVTQPTAILKIIHTVAGCYILAAFFVMGVSAYHLLAKRKVEFFRKSFRVALVFGLVSSLVVAVEGHFHAADVASTQPAKFAAMEAHWETSTNAPMYLFALPDEEGEKNRLEILPIPGMLSFLAFHDTGAEVKGLKDFAREDRPPVLATYIAFRLMVALGGYFILMMLIGWVYRKRIEECPRYLKAMLYSIPLPYIACALGWIVAEVGRQPWIVYNLLRTSDAASPVIEGYQVLITLIGFIVIYSLLGMIGFWLIIKAAKKGPEEPSAADEERSAG